MSGADAGSKSGERRDEAPSATGTAGRPGPVAETGRGLSLPPYSAAAGLALVMWACAIAWAVRAGCAGRERREGGPGGAPSDFPAARIDVNSAGEAVLEALPGIGRTLALRIVTERKRRGPFAGPDDLLRVRGVTRELVERIEAFVEFGEGAERKARP